MLDASPSLSFMTTGLCPACHPEKSLSRQHAAPVILRDGSTTTLPPLSLTAALDGVSEAQI